MPPTLRFLPLAMPFLAAAVMVYGWPVSPDNDLYFHLKCGEMTLRLKQWLLYDIYTYTAQGTPDESWHSWLSQIIFYLLHKNWGVPGLRVLNTALVWITLFFVARYVWQRTRNIGVTTAATTVALLVHHHIQVIRPLLFGEALFAALALGLLGEGRKLTTKGLIAGSLIALAWANLHGSAVVVLPLVLIHCAMQRQPAALLIAAATLVNPRGINLYTYAWELSRAAKSAGNWEWGSGTPLLWIERFAAPPVLQLHLDPVSFVILGVAALVAWEALRHRNALLPLNAFCLLMPFVSMRHALYLLFPATYYFAKARSLRPAWTSHLLIGLAALGLFLFPVHRSGYVITSIDRASDFLEGTGVSGNIFSDSGWGGYLIYRHYPQLKVAFDSRTIVHRCLFQKATELFRLYGKTAWKDIVTDLPEETDLIMALSWKKQALDFLDPEEWVVIFENNHATISLRRNARNRKNLERVIAYYRYHHVPFDRASGFQSQVVWQQARRWFEDHLEMMPWGKWPEPATVLRWKEKEKVYYEARGIPPPLG